jgi:hypothetical protein
MAAALAGCAVPPALQASDSEIALMTVPAHGVQIYECRARANAAPAWTFVAPEAELFDGRGRRIGSHGAGPAWTHDDGSGFAGTLKSRTDAPSGGGIPWLLLTAKPQGTAGTFSKVSSVQRINTVGGLAPNEGCAAATLGQRARVAYRADYVLFVPR